MHVHDEHAAFVEVRIGALKESGHFFLLQQVIEAVAETEDAVICPALQLAHVHDAPFHQLGACLGLCRLDHGRADVAGMHMVSLLRQRDGDLSASASDLHHFLAAHMALDQFDPGCGRFFVLDQRVII